MEQEQKKSPVLKIIGCGCVGLIVLALIGGAVLFMGIGKALKSNDPYQDSVAAVQANQAAIEALGDPIDIIGWFPGGFGGLPGGNISITNGKGEVNFDIKVSGPKGAGTVSVIGTKANGKWTYQTWELKVDGQEKAIPLGK